MLKNLNQLLVYFIFFILTSTLATAGSFKEDLREIRSEINKDNLQKALKKIKKIKIKNENEQDQVNVLFGDIYLKINQPIKAEEFYQKSFFTSDRNVENLAMIGLAEVRLFQGRLDDAISYSKQALLDNPNKIRPNIILAIAHTRLGEGEQAIEVLNKIYSNNKSNADVSLAISDYYSVFEDTSQAIGVLEDFLKRVPNNIKVLDQLGNLYLLTGDKDKALEVKFKVLKYYEYIKNRRKVEEIKGWIISIDPNFFDKPKQVKEITEEKQKEYEEEEINNYDENTIKPNYEDIGFAYNANGSGFILGNGKYVITNQHVIDGAKRIAVRNGLGKVSNAKVLASNKDFDLAVLELEKPYSKEHSLSPSDFYDGKPGDEIIALGFPVTGEGHFQPSITEGIITKTFNDDYPVFQISAIINKGNSGGPVFNEQGQLAGIVFAGTDAAYALEKFGFLPTAVGMGIKSKYLSKLLNYEKKNIPTKKVSYSKSKLYEKVLGTVVLVAVQIDE